MEQQRMEQQREQLGCERRCMSQEQSPATTALANGAALLPQLPLQQSSSGGWQPEQGCPSTPMG
jgi:hypothetical protein